MFAEGPRSGVYSVGGACVPGCAGGRGGGGGEGMTFCEEIINAPCYTGI